LAFRNILFCAILEGQGRKASFRFPRDQRLLDNVIVFDTKRFAALDAVLSPFGWAEHFE
jgi:hypothetical protein